MTERLTIERPYIYRPTLLSRCSLPMIGIMASARASRSFQSLKKSSGCGRFTVLNPRALKGLSPYGLGAVGFSSVATVGEKPTAPPDRALSFFRRRLATFAPAYQRWPGVLLYPLRPTR